MEETRNFEGSSVRIGERKEVFWGISRCRRHGVAVCGFFFWESWCAMARVVLPGLHTQFGARQKKRKLYGPSIAVPPKVN
jgi:hypothetical protein